MLPPFTNNSLPLKPPFAFTGLSARVFPLRASLDALQRICNSYFNIVPPEVGRFRAVVPYVYLIALDYGQLAELLSNLGWFAQQEFFFCTPVEWYKVVNGRWVFHDWAVVTPYIYVDDDLSVPLGRQVYGWPKTSASVTSAPSDWLRNPQAPVTLARLETSVFPELYGGKRLLQRVFLEIERDAPPSYTQVPPVAGNPIAPWMVAAHLAEAVAGFGRDAMGLAQMMRIFAPNPGIDPAFAGEMAQRLSAAFAPGGPGLLANSLNLKQFRQAEAPWRFCYQALTNGRLQTTQFNGGGLLGEERTLLGDLSGGYTIRLHAYPSLPIAQTLGLEVHQRWRGSEADVLTIKPVLPFWYNVDMTYLEGVNLAWRSHDRLWRQENGAPLGRARVAVAPEKDIFFNPTVGSAVDEVSGPFQFSGTTIRVLPLLASRPTLEAFLDSSINGAIGAPIDGQQVRLSLWTRGGAVTDGEGGEDNKYAYVYLTASSVKTVTSPTNNVGDWTKYELAFLVPVKWERRAPGGDWTIEGVGVVPAYSFVSEITAAIERVEVMGFPTVRAEFVRPDSAWMKGASTPPGGPAPQTLLRVDAEVMTALGQGQQATTHPVVTLSVQDYRAGVGECTWPQTAADWATRLRAELAASQSVAASDPAACATARALGLEILGNRLPIALYTLKQFRDVVDPDTACYQSLVRVSRIFDEVADVREIEKAIRVRIYDFPTLRVASSLGLITTPIQEPGAFGIVHAAQAVRPFSISGTITETLGERLLWRAGPWPMAFGEAPFSGVLHPGSALTVDATAERSQQQRDPSDISAVMREAAVRRRLGESDITPAEIRRALATVDPQMIIETALSREWGNRDAGSRWRQGRRQLESKGDIALSGGCAAELADAEAAMYASVPLDGHSALAPMVTEMIVRLKAFTTARLAMEGCFSTVAAWEIAESARVQKSAFAFTAATAETLATAVAGLLDAIDTIAGLSIIGEPTPDNALDPEVQGDYRRLRELVSGPLAAMRGSLGPPSGSGGGSAPAVHEVKDLVWRSFAALRDAVPLARRYCDVQRDALLNRLARTYQKPDFCILRESVGPFRARLLPRSLSWDAEWYCGEVIQSRRQGRRGR